MADPASQAALFGIRTWLDTCLTSHKRCRQASGAFTPSRLLEISYSWGRRRLRLRKMNDEKAEYAALSYCWGGDQSLKATQLMMPQLLHRIEERSLPQTLRDHCCN